MKLTVCVCVFVVLLQTPLFIIVEMPSAKNNILKRNCSFVLEKKVKVMVIMMIVRFDEFYGIVLIF